jgi:hypothetical protein
MKKRAIVESPIKIAHLHVRTLGLFYDRTLLTMAPSSPSALFIFDNSLRQAELRVRAPSRLSLTILNNILPRYGTNRHNDRATRVDSGGWSLKNSRSYAALEWLARPRINPAQERTGPIFQHPLSLPPANPLIANPPRRAVQLIDLGRCPAAICPHPKASYRVSS